MSGPSQRRQWSWFVGGVGLVLIGLCALEYSSTALAVGLVLLLSGLVGLLLSS